MMETLYKYCPNESNISRGEPEYIPATQDEIRGATPDSMHWLPIEHDTKFDDKEYILVKLHYPSMVRSAKYEAKSGIFWLCGSTGFEEMIRSNITHYARVTDPKETA